MESLDVEYIANYISKIVDGGLSNVDFNKVALIYSWTARIREIDRVYEFAKKNYLLE